MIVSIIFVTMLNSLGFFFLILKINLINITFFCEKFFFLTCMKRGLKMFTCKKRKCSNEIGRNQTQIVKANIIQLTCEYISD